MDMTRSCCNLSVVSINNRSSKGMPHTQLTIISTPAKKKSLMSAAEFTKAHQLFIDAVTSISMHNVRKQLKQMKALDAVCARECCLKTISSISEDNDYWPVIIEIIESQLFERPHHHSLLAISPILVSNAAKTCASAKHLYQTLSHLASRLKLNIIDTLAVLGEDGYTAFHLSVMNGDFRATKHLLEIGSDCNKKSEAGNSAISLATAYGRDHLVPLLLRESDVNTQDSDHDTPLIFAAWNNAPRIVASLIKHGADVNKKNRYGSTPIWNAVYQSSAECVLILLSNNSTMDAPCEGTDLFFNLNENDCRENITKLYPGHKRSILWVAVDRIDANEESLKVLLIILEAGYDVTKEHWLRHRTLHPANCQTSLHNCDALLEMLQFLYKHPPNLKDLCRNALRKYHRPSGLPYHEWIWGLHLPQTVNDFLTLSYMCK